MRHADWALAATTVALIALATTLGMTPTARAALYNVHVCDPAYGDVDHVVAYQATYAMAAYSQCGGDSEGGQTGTKTLSTQNGSTVAAFGNATASVSAPGGVVINTVDADVSWEAYQSYGFGWLAGAQASMDRFGSSSWWLPQSCTDTTSTCGHGTHDQYSLYGATGFRMIVACGNASGCYAPWTGWWPHSVAHAYADKIDLSLDDQTLPSLANGRGAAWNSGAWHHGVESIGFDATDNTGIQRLRVELDPGGAHGYGWPIDQGYATDYSYLVPAANHGYDGTIDTRTVSDGTHTIRLAADDGSGNWNTADATLNVDNTAPARPAAPTVAGGETSWHTTNSFQLSWSNPGGQTAPITQAHYEIRNTAGNVVASGTRSASGISSISGLSVPAPGDYTADVYLEDAAGNTNPATASDPVHLKFDNIAPGVAEPERSNGWINAQESLDYPEPITLKRFEFMPVSGIAGYSVTTDGSAPDDTIETATTDPTGPNAAAAYRIADLPQGVSTINARAVSGAGIGSATVGSTVVKVDKTPPQAEAVGAPDPAEWQRQPVALTLTGTDQLALSGMVAADPLQPLEDGAYMSYRVDGGEPQKVRGGSAPLTVADDGIHTIDYQAFDLAGNPSVAKTVRLKVDRTAPETVVFQMPDRDDPTLLTVRASDRTSGIAAGGVIEVRPLVPAATGFQKRTTSGPRRSEVDGWRDVPTSQDGGRLTARIDDTKLHGIYAIRAVVKDNAGNVAIGDRWESGGGEAVIDTSTLRNGVDLRAGLVVPARNCIVPEVRRKTLKTARQAIVRGHCRVGRVIKPKRTRRGYQLVVAKQSPGVGKRLRAGGWVTLRLKAARAHHQRTAVRVALNRTRPAAAKHCKKPRTRKLRALCKHHQPAKHPPATPGPAADSLVPALVVPFGKPTQARGTLTDAEGKPIGNATLEVTAELRVQGAAYSPVGTVRTDQVGGFTYTVAAGPSRTLRFDYQGDQLRRPAFAEVTVGVPASTTIKASRRKLRLRQTLRLTGKLNTLGAPVPDAGKLIDLQAFDRGKWRKFATVRTRRDGGWAFKYRFEATRGVVTYPMRAVVPREADYAFDTGHSRSVKVRVRGQ